MDIGVIGCGYVGGAVRDYMREEGYRVRVYDVDPYRATHSLEDVVGDSALLYVAVPTPTRPDGSQDLGALLEVLDYLRGFGEAAELPVIVIKSTVLPGVLTEYWDLPMVYSPEFLTQNRALYDVANPKRIVIGAEDEDILTTYADFCEMTWYGIPQIHTTLDGAALAKYAANTFGAVKVGFWNDVWELCGHYGVDYEDVRRSVILSGWVAEMHTRVPGPDGSLGYGGACLPKDSAALVAHAARLGKDLGILRAAQAANRERRG